MSHASNAALIAMSIYATYGMGQVASDLNSQRLSTKNEADKLAHTAELLSRPLISCGPVEAATQDKVSALVHDSYKLKMISDSYIAPRNAFIGIAALSSVPALALAYCYACVLWPRGRKSSSAKPS